MEEREFLLAFRTSTPSPVKCIILENHIQQSTENNVRYMWLQQLHKVVLILQGPRETHCEV
jgi:hypothetical protein